MKIHKKISNISQIIKFIPHFRKTELHYLAAVKAKEVELAKFAGYEFVDLVKPILKSLAVQSPASNCGSYLYYLDEAVQMVLEGREEIDIMFYFVKKLERMEGGGADA